MVRSFDVMFTCNEEEGNYKHSCHLSAVSGCNSLSNALMYMVEIWNINIQFSRNPIKDYIIIIYEHRPYINS